MREILLCILRCRLPRADVHEFVRNLLDWLQSKLYYTVYTQSIAILFWSSTAFQVENYRFLRFYTKIWRLFLSLCSSTAFHGEKYFLQIYQAKVVPKLFKKRFGVHEPQNVRATDLWAQINYKHLVGKSEGCTLLYFSTLL